MQQDRILRALAYDDTVRIFFCRTTELVRTCCEKHQTWPQVSIAMGRALSVGALMGATLKEDEHQLALEWKGDGPMRRVVVDARANGNLRGYPLHPQVGMPPRSKVIPQSVSELLGKAGFVHVMHDLGLKDIYRSTVPLSSGEIGPDMAFYYAQSEQIPSAIGVECFLDEEGQVKSAGGWMVQMMPNVEEGTLQHFEQRLQQDQLLAFLHRDEPLTQSIADFLQTSHTVLEQKPLRFYCPCTVERVSRTLISLGRQELQNLLLGDQEIEVLCDFCRTRYTFQDMEIQKLLAEVEDALQV
ncbi:MAG: Hsp33 family molecular chaperone HslO [Myxococcota bacterium]